jgi:DNA-binding response OmpR family regulator
LNLSTAIPGQAPAPDSKIKLLVIDDDAVIRKAASLQLQSQGFEVDVAADVSTALQALRSGKPQLILLDIYLDTAPCPASSSWDGFGMMSWLRHLDEARHIPVVLMTGYTGILEGRALAEGAAGFFRKPVDFASLAANIPQLLAFDWRGPALTAAGSVSCLSTVASPLAGQVDAAQRSLIRVAQLSDLCRRTYNRATTRDPYGCIHVAELAKALGTFLPQFSASPKMATRANWRAAARAADFLAAFSQNRVFTQVPAAPRAVLVVGDDHRARQAISVPLDAVHLPSLQASDFATAARLCENNHFDLVILDVSQSDRTGIAVCSFLRSSEAHKHTPVLCVSDRTGFEHRAKWAAYGDTGFLARPFRYSELVVHALAHLLWGLSRQPVVGPN